MSTEELLEQAQLRFVTDKKPGFMRSVLGKKFTYYDKEGKKITDEATIERLNKLAIPPAYTDVWICPYANGYLQATGFDSKKRKQYRYHPLWNRMSQQEKFTNLLEFATHLPKIRRNVSKHLRLRGMPREKVIAAVVWLLENTLIRIGNEEYEKENKSYGLTTLKNRHATVSYTNTITFQFKGKSGVYHNVHIKNKKVARVIRHCKDLPGQDLFEYYDDQQKIQTISSEDVNEYLKAITGVETTAKDFRTWGGTVLAASAFDKFGISDKVEISKQNITDAVKKVAQYLGNRPATCRKYYIHPLIIHAYDKGHILSNISEKLEKGKVKIVNGLDASENSVLMLLTFMKRYPEVRSS